MPDSTKKVTLLTEDDLFLFNEGSHYRLYEKLGSHLISDGDVQGTYFAVWAPDAEQTFVMGDFNNWSKVSHPLNPRGQSGIWEGFIAGVGKGARYKYHVVSRYNDYRVGWPIGGGFSTSFDGGKTWPKRRLLTDGKERDLDGMGNTGKFTMTTRTAEPRGYMTAVQTPDGMIHLISSGLHYRFNYAWLNEI